MEMQLFILGHVILLAVCAGMTAVKLKTDAIIELVDSNAKVKDQTPYTEDLNVLKMYALWFGLFGFFEIIYLLLHWMIVGF